MIFEICIVQKISNSTNAQKIAYMTGNLLKFAQYQMRFAQGKTRGLTRDGWFQLKILR